MFAYFADKPDEEDSVWIVASVRPDGKLKHLAAVRQMEVAELLARLLNANEREPKMMENENALYD